MKPRKIETIIVHCTDSPDIMDIGLAEIDEWHRERGFSGVEVAGVNIHCGYHYIVRRDGSVEIGRPDWAMGAHVKGHNRSSIGVVWVGRNSIGVDQYDVLVRLIKSLVLKYGLKASAVFGHKELNPNKSCPNIDMAKLRDAIEIEVALG